ncbi:MAG: DUF1772 domain-containing protein [Parvularculaceae bacterium]|nr:DUF1772 domain-containing protein [Parvularculaceae bacterium]
MLATGPLVGAKIFDLLVLVGAWSADPPRSLRLLPYGDNWPVDTGEFFIPGSAATLLASLGALIAGWTTPWRYRAQLVAPALIILLTLAITVTVFWPLNSALWHASIHSPGAEQDPAKIIAMVREWVRLDWVRIALAAIAFIVSVNTLSQPYPATRASPDSPPVRAAVFAGVGGIIAFVAYFLIRGLA